MRMPQEEVFVSYSREDNDKVLALTAKLRAAGVPLWMDVRSIDDFLAPHGGSVDAAHVHPQRNAGGTEFCRQGEDLVVVFAGIANEYFFLGHAHPQVAVQASLSAAP